MQFIFDHIYATIIAGTVMFMLALLNLTVLEVNWTQSSVNAGKTLTLDLANWLEQDLKPISNRADNGQPPIVVWPTQSAQGNTTLITLYRDSLDVSSTPFDTVRIQMRYTLQTSDSVAIADSSVQAFQLIRQTRTQIGAAGAWSGWAEDGRSRPRLMNFSVTPLRPDGANAISVAETAYLRVRFVLVPPFIQENSFLNLMNWQTTVVV